jgi:hypothetical protein
MWWKPTCGSAAAIVACSVLVACSGGAGTGTPAPGGEGTDRVGGGRDPSIGGGTDPGAGRDMPGSGGSDPIFGGPGGGTATAPKPCTSKGGECGNQGACSGVRDGHGYCVDLCGNGATCKGGQICLAGEGIGVCKIPCTTAASCPAVAGYVVSCVRASSGTTAPLICNYVPATTDTPS